MQENTLLSVVIGISLLGLAAAYLMARWVLKKDTGTELMNAISGAIKEGAEAFLKRQYKTIGVLVIIFMAVIFVGYGLIRAHRDFDPIGTSLSFAFWVALSFLLGAICSLIAGYIGMWISIRAHIRTAVRPIKKIN